MRRHSKSWTAPRLGLALALAGLTLGLVAPAAAKESESCRQWRGEHRGYEVEVVRLYLTGATQRALDEAVFELLQREAYLTSCEQSVRAARVDLVGWRLVGRVPEEYPSAVVESLLARAGFDVSLDALLSGAVGVAYRPAPPARTRGPRARDLRAAR